MSGETDLPHGTVAGRDARMAGREAAIAADAVVQGAVATVVRAVAERRVVARVHSGPVEVRRAIAHRVAVTVAAVARVVGSVG
jgi:hypothetical protein